MMEEVNIMIGDKGGGATVDGGDSSYHLHLRSASCGGKPAWLLSTLADLDQRIRALLLNSHGDKDQNEEVTFAQRAEFYYQQRPLLLSLLQDLHNAYLALADRYCQSLHKHQNHRHFRAHSSTELLSVSSVHHNHTDEDYHSDAESSLSYQLSSVSASTIYQNHHSDEMIAELVMKNVEFDLMVHELGMKERQVCKSSRKIEIQSRLLEVLESERLILLKENAGLRYKVSALVSENKGLASESMFMKRKAGELARCVLKMREDHRVCMLSQKVEDLQAKVYWLEKRNQEYYQQLVKKAKTLCPSCKGTSSNELTYKDNAEGASPETRFQGVTEKSVEKKRVRISKWWVKFKNSDLLFLCKPHPSRSVGC